MGTDENQDSRPDPVGACGRCCGRCGRAVVEEAGGGPARDLVQPADRIIGQAHPTGWTK